MTTSNKILLTIGLILAALGVYFVVRGNRKATAKTSGWAKIVNPSVIRNDSGGDGHFGTSRNRDTGKGTHEGVDISAKLNQKVYAPIDGKIVRIAKPYADDSRFSGLLMEGLNGEEIKIFYINPLKVGENINRGELIGTAQSISKKYNTVTDHIHVEYRQDGVLTDPTTLILT
jgi:murein DD-endopeptidase MepM/ murein hydrolase activator NlpD